jgi:hypothetical protein
LATFPESSKFEDICQHDTDEKRALLPPLNTKNHPRSKTFFLIDGFKDGIAE